MLEIDKEWLFQKYSVEKMSTTDISKVIGCNRYIVVRKLHEYGIDVRPSCFQKKDVVYRLCASCGKETTNPKFCSRSCAAITNNTKFPKWEKKPKKKYYCKKCGILIASRNVTCSSCSRNIVNWDNVTYGEIIGKRKYQKNSRIRDLAKRKTRKLGMTKCCKCGYDKHVETHHIKNISSFLLSAKIGEINDLSNLLVLCPNCHWELEHSS